MRKRAVIIQALRCFFIDRGYLEVDTPIRLPALAPEAHIEPEPAGDWFLQTSPELCMKRLLAAGNPKLFQICKCFRKGERGRTHLGEFTMLEWYRADSDYHDLMADCEQLFQFIGERLGHGNMLEYKGCRIALPPPWQCLAVSDAFDSYAPLSVEEAIARDLFDEMLVTHIEPQLGRNQPVFLCDYPAVMASLSAISKNNPRVAERFELYVNGLELANGFTELIDPEEQRCRFEQERRIIEGMGRLPGPMPEPFLGALADMPPAAGIALGVDRLAMVFTDAARIDEVIPFRPEEL